MAGPGLLAYIVTSKFAEYLRFIGWKTSSRGRASRSRGPRNRSGAAMWPTWSSRLYQLMAERVRASHVVATDDTIMPMQSTGKTANARMWVYVGDDDHPYNIFDFTLNRGRDGPKYFLQDYSQVLLADAYGGYNGVVAGNGITRAGCWAHLRRKIIEAEKTAPEIAREAVELVRALYAVEKQATAPPADRAARAAPGAVGTPVGRVAREAACLERAVAAQASHGRGHQLRSGPVEGTQRLRADGAVPIDNNVSEREMKRVVLNRKNSLFVGNARGGRTAAILASLTSTCRRHDVDPQLYLTQLLVNLPATSIS